MLRQMDASYIMKKKCGYKLRNSVHQPDTRSGNIKKSVN